MALFEYQCPAQHVTEAVRSFARRDESPTCPHCQQATVRIEISRNHVPPDGVYSYAPNLGSEAAFERRLHAIKNGEKLIKKDVRTLEQE